MDIGAIVFLSTLGTIFILGTCRLIYLLINQNKCNHDDTMYYPSKDANTIRVHCLKCNKTEIYHMRDNIVKVFKDFTNTTLSVSRVMDVKENKIKLEIEKL